MSNLQLDDRSLRSLMRFRGLLIGGMSGVMGSLSLGQVSGVPDWVALSLGLLSFAALAACFVIASRVRCPGCKGRLLVRFAPSWYRTPKPDGKDCVRCAQCHESIDISGGARPSSITDLEASNMR